MTEAPKVNVHEYGQWVFIMNEEDVYQLREDIAQLRMYFITKIAKQSSKMAEQSKEAVQNLGRLAVGHLESQIPPDKKDEMKPLIDETKEAIENIK